LKEAHHQLEDDNLKLKNKIESLEKKIIGLEKQKKQLGSKMDEPGYGENYVKNFALRMFKVADDDDRAGTPTKTTAANFLVAGRIFDVLSQFGALSNDLQEKRKYAKWKTSDIMNKLKSGQTPTSGGPGDVNDVSSPPSQLNPTGNQPNDIPTPSFDPPPKKASDLPGARPTPFASNPNQPQIPMNQKPAAPDYSAAFPTPPSNSQPTPPSYAPPPQSSYQPNPTPPTSNQAVQFPTLPKGSIEVGSNYKPTEADVNAVRKYVKYVNSSLDYDDYSAALKYLKMSVAALTGAPHNG